MNNGVMFVSTPGNQVIAIDAKTGNVLWRYRRPRAGRRDRAARHEPRRRAVRRQGVLRRRRSGARRARCEDRQGSLDDEGRGQQDRLLHVAGAARRRRQGDGRRVGRRTRHPRIRRRLTIRTRARSSGGPYTVPAPGEPGSETWPKGDQWKTGGGPVWVTGNYDPDTNLAYWGTGNGGPWMGDQRPGDNLYTSSTIAIDVATGTDQGPLTSTTRTNRGTGTKSRRRSWSTTSATAGPSRA